MKGNYVTLDGCEAAARIAYKVSEVAIIYPITPSSPLGEHADSWAASSLPNLWGSVPKVYEMQSEGGAAGSVHGALQAGSITSTFTASQGLLLMIPNMYKIAGELTSTVFHVTARSLATSALSIFGDHSDVMSCRSTGWAMLFANSVQEAADMALIAHASTLEARVPFMNIFDGFRTSHEVMKINLPNDEVIRALINDDLIKAHRERSLTPDRPVMRGTAQNPDVYFQTREAVNPYYLAVPGIVQKYMDQFAGLTGRQYKLYEYMGAPDAERVLISMGSSCEAIEETVENLNASGEKVGLLKIRLFRPFSTELFTQAIPESAKVVGVLDRTKEPGSVGEPLYQDVITSLFETGRVVKAVGGRYGLSSKEFTPAMVKALYDELGKDSPKTHFTIGIHDDVTGSSIDFDSSFITEADDCYRAVFWGLGSDGTVGANKNTIKIIGEETDFNAQGYFVYDSKKAGARTVSHLRFGPKPIKSTYLISSANFIGIHQFHFLETYPVLDMAAEGATILLNSPYPANEVWQHIPRKLQETIINRKLKLYIIDAYKLARDIGLGGRMNTILQTCFFAISQVIPQETAIDSIKKAIKKTYGKRGETVVQKNVEAVDAALERFEQVSIPSELNGSDLPPVVDPEAPEFVRTVTAEMIAERGDLLPVSKLPVDGTFPTATSMWEKRGLTMQIPVWDPEVCIQCGKCVLVCPHGCIRSKVTPPGAAESSPEGFLSTKAKWKEIPDALFTIQVSGDDCTGCTLCVETCPAKNRSEAGRKAINMESYLPLKEDNSKHWDFFLGMEEHEGIRQLPLHLVKNIQTRQPLFEFSGACAGCGETPYVKLVSQLYGDHAMIANATGCSSIYGGNLPTTPWAKDKNGRGPAWSNSLFEDNAEFGYGMRVAIDQQNSRAKELLGKLGSIVGDDLSAALLEADQSTQEGIEQQRERVLGLKAILQGSSSPEALDLLSLADALVKKSVWIMGGDGWAYDIGFGGLDHVLAQGLNVNVLVLDTQVYSNTGGQASKATPLAAVAKFAAAGKRTGRKDLGLIAMSYGNIYVAQIAMGSNDAHTVRAIQEAEAYDGPSLVIAYSHCVGHGINTAKGLRHQKLATQTGAWPLFRYNPALKDEGKNPFSLDSQAPSLPLKDYLQEEGRFRILHQSHPDTAEALLVEAQTEVQKKWNVLSKLGDLEAPGQTETLKEAVAS